MPYKIEFQLAAGKSYLDGAKKESHFIVVPDQLDPCNENNDSTLMLLMAREAKCSPDDIFHYWHARVVYPLMISPADVTPVELFDIKLIGKMVHCGHEVDVILFVNHIGIDYVTGTNHRGDVCIFPFNEVHGIVKHEVFQ